MSGTLLRIEHLKKEYPGATPLRDVNLVVNEGEVIAIIGPSGTGKSTLLRQINQMERATAGKIFFREEDITAPGYRVHVLRQKIGMIFQSFNLFSHLTVIENIMAAPVALLGLSRQEAGDRAKEMLAKVGLAEKALSYPDELSGGQQQRIAIVRALAMAPEIMLFDEPTSALDPTMVGEVEAVIRRVAEAGVTMMIVTHDMAFARRISSRVLYMDEGVVYEDGPAEQIFERPQREKTRQFIRRLKVLEFSVDSPDYDFIGAGSEIDRYCQSNMIPARVKYRIRLAFEELVQQMLWSILKETPLTVTVEYAEAEETATVTVRYGGEKYDPATGDNALSYKVLKSSVEELTYGFDPSAETGNTVFVRIRE